MNLRHSYQILKSYRRDPLGYIQRMKELHGHRSSLNVFGKELHIFSHPDDIVHVLKTNHGAYSKGRTTKALAQFLGNGLITNEGESWRKRHRLIRPLMNLKSIYQLAPKILQTTTEFLPLVETTHSQNVFTHMNKLTWRIVLSTLFSQKVTPEMDQWLEDILFLMHVITTKTRSSIPIPFWLPTSDHREMKKVIRRFDDFVYGMIKNRKAGHHEQDLLQLLIDAKEEGTSQMSDREIRDEIMTFLMAGHETITNTMTMAMITLAKHQEYQQKLRAEVDHFFETKNFEALEKAPLLSAVFDETLRLFPPVWVFMRQAEKEDRIGDFVIRKGANVVVAPILTQRSADIWERPDDFLPERFLEPKKNIHPGSFYPFGLGPRACIGAAFAGIEGKIILASFIKHFEWQLNNPSNQTFEAGIALRPTNNLMLSFRRR